MYALLIILVYLVYTYIFKGSSNKLTGVISASTPYVVSEDSIKALNNNQQVFNYTTSVWIYIDNWSITPTLNKPILSIDKALDIYLGNTDNNLFVDVHPFSSTESYMNIQPLDPAPIESLTSINITTKKKSRENMQNVNLEGYSKVSTSATVKKSGNVKDGFTTGDYSKLMTSLSATSSINKFTAVVPAIPLQTWTNITVSIHDKAIDIYINGKLAQSNLFSFVPAPVKSSITLTPAPGFIGWTSNMQYYPYNLTPAQIENNYKSGYTGSPESLLSLLGKYSMRLVFIDNTQKN